MINVPLPFQELYTSKKPIILLTGGRGSGKSFNTALFCKRLTYQKGHIILFSRYTLTSAEVSIIPEFNHKIEVEGDVKYFDVTKNEIINKFSDSSIIFRGIKTSSGNQTANLKSIHGLTTFVVDEAEEWESEEDFDKIRLSIRDISAQNRCIIVMNPTDRNHFIYKKYIQDSFKNVNFDGEPIQISTHPDVLHIHSTYLDCKEFLSEQFLNEVESIKNTNYEKYKRIVLGQWVNVSEGAIFTNWEQGLFNDKLPCSFGMDFGFSNDPTTLIKVAIDEGSKTIYAKELCYSTKLSQDDIVQVLDTHCNRGELITSDSAEPRLIEAIRQKGFNIVSAEKGKDSIREGILFIQDYKIIAEGTNLVNELQMYQWNDKRANIPLDRDNHLIDALRYAMEKFKTPSFYFG